MGALGTGTLELGTWFSAAGLGLSEQTMESPVKGLQAEPGAPVHCVIVHMGKLRPRGSKGLEHGHHVGSSPPWCEDKAHPPPPNTHSFPVGRVECGGPQIGVEKAEAGRRKGSGHPRT